MLPLGVILVSVLCHAMFVLEQVIQHKVIQQETVFQKWLKTPRGTQDPKISPQENLFYDFNSVFGGGGGRGRRHGGCLFWGVFLWLK